MGRRPHFIAEWHLQRVARWLTLFGYPTQVVPKLTKECIYRCAGGRCKILTTSRRLEDTFKKLKVEYLILPNTEDWITQLCMVLRQFKITPSLELKFCPHCLGELLPVDPDEIKDKIPYYSYKCGKNFTICSRCGRIYWEGGHKKLMERTLSRIKNRCGSLFGDNL